MEEGNRKRHIAARYVEKVGERAYCRIEGNKSCTYIQKIYDVGNFIRHFRTRHTDLAKEYGLLNEQTLVKKPRNIPKKIGCNRQATSS